MHLIQKSCLLIHGILVLFLASSLGLLAQVPGNSLVLNGSTDYATFPHNALLNPGSAISVEAWIYPCKVSGSNLILNKWWCGGYQQNAYYFSVYDGKLRWGWDLDGCGNGARIYESSAASIQPNHWYHVAVVHTSTSVSLYLNGLPLPGQLFQGSYSAILQNQEPFRIGVYRDINNTYWGHFTGRIDEVRVWNHNLSAAEILARYNTPLTGNEYGLVAYYNMDNTGGGNGITIPNMAMLTGGALNGTLVGTSTSPYFLPNNMHLLPLDLGTDTLLCDGDVLLLDPGLTGVNYLWQDGSALPQYLVSLPGNYWVQVNQAGCSNQDTIHVAYAPIPYVYLGPDTSICEGDTLVLNAGNPGATYIWHDGHTGPTCPVTHSGQYWVQVTMNNCSTTDTILVHVMPPPVVNLGNDTLLCPGLQWVLDPGIPGATYTWQDGSNLPVFSVTQAGTYWVSVQLGNCFGHDTILIDYHVLPEINLGPDTTLCKGESLYLEVDPDLPLPRWSTDEVDHTILVNEAGIYWCEVDHPCGASRDSIQLELIDCHCGLYIPNAFSPNIDGLNERFEVKGNCILSYRILIFNRWGQQLYESHSLDEPWDGRFKDQACPLSSYVYRIDYTFSHTLEKHTRLGSVLIVQ